MIGAYKNQTITGLQQQLVKIKEMELNYWVSTFRSLTSQSALLCGFTFSGFTAIKEFKGSQINLNTMYLVSTALSLGFGLLTVSTSSLCLMFGPGKALRAQSLKGIEDTIETLKQKSYQSFFFFISELFFFHVSSFTLMWIRYSPLVSFIVNIILFIFLLQFISEGQDIMQRLFVKDD